MQLVDFYIYSISYIHFLFGYSHILFILLFFMYFSFAYSFVFIQFQVVQYNIVGNDQRFCNKLEDQRFYEPSKILELFGEIVNNRNIFF